MPKPFSRILAPAAILFLVVLVAFLTNYIPGTWLSGWDNLQSELMPWQNTLRGLYSVWQDNQSFGNVAGMAFPTTFFHALLTGILSLFLSTHFIRYALLFGLLYLGALGTYFLLRFLGFDEKRDIFAYIGGIFYILNFGHIQMMSVPTESFISFLGLLPWEILLFLKILGGTERGQTLKYSLTFLLVNLFGSFQFLTQTIFVVYFMVLCIFSLEHVLVHRSRRAIKRILFALGVTVIGNLFWIFPQIYFVTTNLEVTSASKINQIATQNVLSQSAGRANLLDFTRFIGVYYDLYDARGNQIFQPWKDHFSNPVVLYTQLAIFVVMAAGFFRKFKHKIGFCLLFLLSLVTLVGQEFLSFSPVLAQIFRSPFTKFITVYVLTATYFFVSGLESISLWIFRHSRFKDSLFRHLFAGLLGLLLVTYVALPAFGGNMVANIVKIHYPDRYEKLMEDFRNNTDPDAKIALLPDISFWGWFRYNWGYEGSGFLWYGMPQAIISRTFDVWNFNSESFYWELKYAMESQNAPLFDSVLQKYQIQYLVFDSSLLSSSVLGRGAALENLETMLQTSDLISLYRDFDGVRVYSVEQRTLNLDNVSLLNSLPTSGPEYKITNWDETYVAAGNYSSADSPDYYYPFIDLMTQTHVPGKRWTLTENIENLVIKASLGGLRAEDYSLVLPNEDLLNTSVFLGDEVKTYKLGANVKLDKDFLEISIPKELVESVDLTQAQVSNCGSLGGEAQSSMDKGSLVVESSNRGVACFGYDLPLLAHWAGYLVTLDTQNISGNNLFFYLLGSKSNKYSKIEDLLETGRHYFILNPGYFYDDGYGFSFQNQSFGPGTVKNKLNSIRIYLFPVEYLKKLHLKKVGSENIGQTNSSVFTAEKLKPYLYKVNAATSENALVLWQSFDNGWLAMCGLQPCNARHVRINNWANGWVSEEGFLKEDVRLVFWPQYLAYAGFAAVTALVAWNTAALLREVRSKRLP